MFEIASGETERIDDIDALVTTWDNKIYLDLAWGDSDAGREYSICFEVDAHLAQYLANAFSDATK